MLTTARMPRALGLLLRTHPCGLGAALRAHRLLRARGRGVTCLLLAHCVRCLLVGLSLAAGSLLPGGRCASGALGRDTVRLRGLLRARGRGLARRLLGARLRQPAASLRTADVLPDPSVLLGARATRPLGVARLLRMPLSRSGRHTALVTLLQLALWTLRHATLTRWHLPHVRHALGLHVPSRLLPWLARPCRACRLRPLTRRLPSLWLRMGRLSPRDLLTRGLSGPLARGLTTLGCWPLGLVTLPLGGLPVLLLGMWLPSTWRLGLGAGLALRRMLPRSFLLVRVRLRVSLGLAMSMFARTHLALADDPRTLLAHARTLPCVIPARIGNAAGMVTGTVELGTRKLRRVARLGLSTRLDLRHAQNLVAIEDDRLLHARGRFFGLAVLRLFLCHETLRDAPRLSSHHYM